MSKRHPRALNLAWTLLLCLLAPAAAAASLLGGPATEDNYLPVDQAFHLEPLAQHGNTITVVWEIAPQYYLYRHALRFTLTNAQGLQLGKADIPPGHKKHDDYFGEVETYSDQLRVSLPLTKAPRQATPVELKVRYQGCAEAGLCYPPQTRTLALTLRPAGAAAQPSQPAAPSAAAASIAPAAATDQALAGRLANQPLWLTLLQFLGFGLLLAFTPCVLPMLPILAGVIAGSQRRSAVHGFTLALAYVLAMALAYTCFGIIAALLGHNVQAILQKPAVVLSFAGVFVLLSLSMFGLFKLGLPSALQTRLSNLSARQRGGSYVGAAVMGFIGALIVGPCVAAPLAGALLYIARSGDPVVGGAALFSMGLGMGLPLLLLGAFEGRLLPRAGAWMTRVNHLFGFLLLGVAVWLAGRVLDGALTLGLWTALAIALALWLLWQLPERRAWRALTIVLALALTGWATLMGLGARHGGSDPLLPLAHLRTQPPASLPFQTVHGLAGVQAALAEPQARNRIVMLDFYADWCISCRLMERDIFPAPSVQPLLTQMLLLRADLTDFDATDQALLRHFELAGPPALLFFSNGRELRSQRLVGEPDAQTLATHLRTLLEHGNQ